MNKAQKIRALKNKKLLEVDHGCERCGNRATSIHHKDRNHHNEVIENYEALCNSCHAKHHLLLRWEQGAIPAWQELANKKKDSALLS